AAVLGNAFAPSDERGVYRTRNGGRTWQRVLFRDRDTGASDVALDPANPRIVFAGLWQTRRRPWELISGGPGSGLFVSNDDGDTWTELVGDTPPPSETETILDKLLPVPRKRTGGLPPGPWGKVGVGIAPSDSKRIYALIEADKGGLFRSDDGGGSWKLVNSHHAIRQRAWYYSTLTVHPTNPNVVYFPQVPFLRTTDGGATLQRIRGMHHGDHHDL